MDNESADVTSSTGLFQKRWIKLINKISIRSNEVSLHILRLGGIRDVEQMGFETGPEDSYGRCGGNVFRQTVPTRTAATGKAMNVRKINRVMPWLHAPIFPTTHCVVLVSRTRKSDISDDTDDTSDDASDFLVPGSDGRLLAGSQKTSSEQIEKNEHAHSVRFSQTKFLNLGRLGDVGRHLGRGNRCHGIKVRFRFVVVFRRMFKP